MTNDPRTLMVFGVGKLGGPVVDVLAARYPHHQFIVVSRSATGSLHRANLTKYMCSQWGTYPTVIAETSDLMDVSRTAELLATYEPDIVFNATTPFPWWLIDKLPQPLAARANQAGPGTWCALDCVLPMRLSEALSLANLPAVHVNACYPDMVNAFLHGHGRPPIIGIGNLSNLIPGLRLSFASSLGLAPEDVKIRLVAHHFTSLNAPTLGGSGGAPYHLSVQYPGGEEVYRGPGDHAPFQLVRASYPRVRGLDGQGVTVTSASTVLATLLNGVSGHHHVPGPLGLVGGYPVHIAIDGSVELDLPPSLDRSAALSINSAAQAFDGVEDVRPGRVTATATAKQALAAITGVDLPTVDIGNAVEISLEVIDQLRTRHGLHLAL